MLKSYSIKKFIRMHGPVNLDAGKPFFNETIIKKISRYENFIIFKTDFSVPSFTGNIFSYKRFFKDITKPAIYNPKADLGVPNHIMLPTSKAPYLEPIDIANIQKGNTKLIFYFHDFWGTKTEEETDKIINSGHMETYDIYGWLYPQLKKLNIVQHSVFVTPLPLKDVKIYPDFQLVYYNAPFNIFSHFGIPWRYKKEIPTHYNYKFAWLNRRARSHRVYALYKLVEANLLDSEAIFSFHFHDHDCDTIRAGNFIEHIVEGFIGRNEYDVKVMRELKENYVPAIIHEEDSDKMIKEIPNALPHILMQRYWIEVVSETNYSDHKAFITEKVARPIVYRKPFIVFGDRYTLKTLQDEGFKTFSNFWDESYDALPTGRERIDAVVKTLKEIFQTHDWQLQLPKEMQEIVDFNYNHYYNEHLQPYRNAFQAIVT